MRDNKIDLHGRGKCLDTLDDAEISIQRAKMILRGNSFSNGRETPVQSSVLRFLDDFAGRIVSLRKKCMELDHEEPTDEIKLGLHLAEVDGYVETASILSRAIQLLQTWNYQLLDRNLQNDIEFGERLVSEIFGILGIDTQPVFVFADRFTAFDIGDTWFVTVPYVFHNVYSRWWGVAHEIGHAFFTRNEKEIDRITLINEANSYLRNEIPEIVEEERKEAVGPILLLVFAWLGELLSDYVALSLFGFHYLLEMRQFRKDLAITVGSKSHPPMDFRLNFLRWVLKKKGYDLRELDSQFDFPTSIPKEIDPILNLISSSKMAELLSEWILAQESYRKIEDNWMEILELMVNKDRHQNASLVSRFAALSIKATTEDATDSFLGLKSEFDDS